MTGIDPQNMYMISDLDTLKVISDPVRFKIFRIINDMNLSGENCTAKMISEAMDIPQTKIYYHLGLLEKENFIRVSDTRSVNGILEKQYQVTAYKLSISPDLFSSTEADDTKPHKMILDIFNETLAEIQNNLALISQPDRKGAGSLSLAREQIQLLPEEFDEFSERFQALLAEYKERSSGHRSGTKLYGLLLALYPLMGSQKGTKGNSENE